MSSRFVILSRFSLVVARGPLSVCLVTLLLLSWGAAAVPAHAGLLEVCPDDDFDFYHDCTVPGCDATGLTCGDCDDQDGDIHPGASEICDHRDNDCDGAVDEGYPIATTAEKILDPTRKSGDEFGTSMAGLEDVDGDGAADFVVGNPQTLTGHVTLFSGATRTAICTASDGASGDDLGTVVVAAGDMNGDGYADFAASAPRADGGKGAVAVFSGNPATACALIRRCTDPDGVAGHYLGSDHGLAALDLTGDGVAEILAGGRQADTPNRDAGIVVVFDGSDCSVRYRVYDPTGQTDALFGFAVTSLPDVTGDAVPDFAASSPGYNDAVVDMGAVLVFSGADGGFVRRIVDDSPVASDWLGYSLAAFDDRNSDSWADLAAGSPYRDTSAGNDAGEIVILSSQGGTSPVLRRMSDAAGAAADRLGWSLAVVEDEDGDGVREVLAGAPLADTASGASAGRAVLFSGATGAKLRTFEDANGAYDDRMGECVAGIGDLSGDGAGEYLAGSRLDDVPKTGVNAGSVLLFVSESDCDDDGVSPFGDDCDDHDGDRFPGNPEICDSVDNDCDAAVDEDEDGDGWDACEEETACLLVADPNHDPSVYPGAVEVCNGVDDDCDGSIDDGVDADGDGITTPCDCDDDPATGYDVHPGAVEVCNHRDDDCGGVDEGFASVVTSEKLHDPSQGGAFLGRSVAALGDVDDDGVPDFVAGYPGDATVGSFRGSVLVFSGATRSVLCRAVNDQAGSGEQLGAPVVGTGDLDGDSYPDFAAAAYVSDAHAYDGGEVLIFSGRTCAVIRHLTDPAGASYDHLGEENGLAAVDLTGDGIAEIVAGANYADPGGVNEAGKAVVFSIQTGSVLMTLTDPLGVAHDRLGISVAGVGDLTGDGVPEIAVGEYRDDYGASDGGSVLVFSGADGTLVARLVDPLAATSDWLGWSVASAGDLNADGWPEILVGARNRATAHGGDGGQVLVFSGKDRTLLYRVEDPDGTGNDYLGWSVAPFPDVDGDGVAEFIAGAPYGETAAASDAGRVVLFSGATGAKIRSFEDPQGGMDDYLGFSVAGIEDLNGDGGPEVLAGESNDDVPKVAVDRGAVMVFLTESDCDGDGYGPTGIDCDDQDADRFAGNPEICDSKDNDCDLAVDEDEDGDDYDACAETSCDPARDPNRNPAVYPGAPELCNGLDDDCDGSVDEGPDADGDTVSAPCDCNDADEWVHPGATELCNHVADACGLVDDGFTQVVSSEKHLDLYPVALDNFGLSLAGIGDANGDGVPDFAAGSSYDDTTAPDTGQVTVFSGSDRRVICRSSLTGAGAIAQVIAGIGDVNGDGAGDVAAAVRSTNRVVVLSGNTCEELVRCTDPAAGTTSIGWDHGLAPWVDVTGDGRPEFLAGADNWTPQVGHSGRGLAFTITGPPSALVCSVLFAMTDPEAQPGDSLGYAIAGIGDLTGDRIPDVIAGEPNDNSLGDTNGAVLLFSGADGSFVKRIVDPQFGTRDHLGYSVAAIEDLNDDGWPEILAGSIYRDVDAVANAGEVVVFSGKDASVIRRLDDPAALSDDRLGWSLAVLDDVDGDGRQDVVAGATYADVGGVVDAGRAVVFSSVTGAKLASFENDVNTQSAHFGYSLASAGDLSGDGIPEILVGCPYEDGAAGADTGSFTIFSLESECDGDGLAPFGGDCDDTDINVWRVPTETLNLRFTIKTSLTWDPPADSGQGVGSLLYDTLRADDSVGFLAATCLDSDDGDLVTTDTQDPDPGAVFFYLSRAQNSCGDGDPGNWGLGDEPPAREVGACP